MGETQEAKILSIPNEEKRNLRWEGLINTICRQVDFYFSDENYFKDNFLRSQAYDDGWTSLKLVMRFNKMKELTNSPNTLNLVQVCAARSALVEVSECGEWV